MKKNYLKEKNLCAILNSFSIQAFHGENNIKDYDDKNVVYIAFIGKFDGEFLCKYGWSHKIINRETKSHRRAFGKYNGFVMIDVIETDNNIRVEKIFEKSIKLKGIHRKKEINGTEQREFFAINDIFTIKKAITLMKSTAKKNPLPIIADYKFKIAILEAKVKLEKEKRKNRHNIQTSVLDKNNICKDFLADYTEEADAESDTRTLYKVLRKWMLDMYGGGRGADTITRKEFEGYIISKKYVITNHYDHRKCLEYYIIKNLRLIPGYPHSPSYENEDIR